MVAAGTLEQNAGMWLPTEHFASAGPRSNPLIQPNLPEQARKNKTIGLEILKGTEPDGR
jgi:hypothetical protein